MSKKALLGAVLPFISNPVVLAAVGIGAVGYTIYELLSKEQDNGSETVPDGANPLNEPLNVEFSTVDHTVRQPHKTARVTVDALLNPTVKETYASTVFSDLTNRPQEDEAFSEDASKKEMIRQAMSELGKRSAAARRDKRHNK